MKKLIFILSVFIPITCFSQEFNFYFEPDSIPVEVEGWNPYCPWAGGDSETTPEFCDIDTDGDLDFFNGNINGKVTYYENTGSNLNPDFSLITKDFANIDISNIYMGRTTPEFCDLDGDGDLDLFSGDGRGLIHYWENIGSSINPEYEWITDSLDYIEVIGMNTVDFVDLDSDGDFDLFLGDYYGNIVYYLNEGDSANWNFTYIVEQFSGIDVGDNASPCFIDIDADNDLDLFIGNENGYIWYYRNDGDSINYDFTYITNYYDSIDVGSYASPEFADIDGDGDYDLFVGSEDYTWYYENIGTPESPDFEYITNYYLTFQPGLKVQVVDINDDGDEDLIIGNGGTMTYTENVGTSTEPSFLYVNDNFQGITRSSIKPCFVDLDDDGDYDLLAGEGVIPGPPSIAYYINDGTPMEPDFRLVNENYITNQNFFVNACPSVADIDSDGDYDLFVTTDDDCIYFYLNEGNPVQAQFELESSQWQGIYFPPLTQGWRGMAFGDLDEDGDLDLLFASIEHYNLRFYRNVGNPYSAVMEVETDEFLPGFEIQGSFPYLVDIDDDNDLDLFVGDGFYGVSFFRNRENNAVNPPPGNQPYTFTLHQNYPNPFNASTVIPFTLDRKLPVKVTVYNQLGQEVWSLVTGHLSLGYHEVVWDAAKVGSGVYLVRLEIPQGAETLRHTEARKVMVVK